jgi:hypothetical protein
MFRWYKNAAICYVYLSDVSTSSEESLSRSRWFTRGWTLQELLAPRRVTFYNNNWTCLGTKVDLVNIISAITSIRPRFLLGENDLNLAPVCTRMSWAARRETSRTEDLAYCLLGIFDINMPLLYGEGQKAFQRLQHKVWKRYPHDFTILAWGDEVDMDSWSRLEHNLDLTSGKIRLQENVQWNKERAHAMLLGLLADHPRRFAKSGHLMPWLNAEEVFADITVKKGLSPPLSEPRTNGTGYNVELPEYPKLIRISRSSTWPRNWAYPEIVQQAGSFCFACLPCGESISQTSCVVIPLLGWGYSSFGRTKGFFILRNDVPSPMAMRAHKMKLHVETQLKQPVEHGDIIFRILPPPPAWLSTDHAGPLNPAWFTSRYYRMDRVVKPGENNGVHATVFLCAVSFRRSEHYKNKTLGIRIILWKDARDVVRQPGGRGHSAQSRQVGLKQPISVQVSPVFHSEDDSEGSFQHEGLYWSRNLDVPKLTPPIGLAQYTMKLPTDEWEFRHPRFPSICIRVDRMPLKSTGHIVDVIEIFATPEKSNQVDTSKPIPLVRRI